MASNPGPTSAPEPTEITEFLGDTDAAESAESAEAAEAAESTEVLENTSKESQDHEQASSYEWKNWTLRKTWTAVFLALDIAIITVILTLERISRTRNGIAEVSEATSASLVDVSVSQIISNAGLLWTTLPSFLMALYRLIWESIVSAAADRQPYVELRKPKQHSRGPRCSIMLDYHSYSSLYRWAVAFRRGHWILGVCMALNVTLSVFLVPITAYLLTAATVSIRKDIPVGLSSSFNSSLLTTRTDAQPAIIAATAHLVHGANPPPWVTAEYAFEPFSTGNVTTGNITVDVDAYSGYLDCQLKSQSEYTVSTVNRVSVDLDDRGCRVPTLLVPLSFSNTSIRPNTQTIYAKTWSTDTCSGKAHYSRLGLLSGGDSTDSSSTLHWNLSLISCIPSFWKSRGALTLTLHNAPSSSSFDFVPHPNATELDPSTFRVLVNALPTFQVYDPTATFWSDAFGRAVFEYAKKTSPAGPLDPPVLLAAMQEVFSAMFAFLAGTALLQRVPTAAPPAAAGAATEVTASLAVGKTRLFVFAPVAYTVVVMLVLVVGCNVVLIWDVEVHPSCLREEPRGLLRMAALAGRSNLGEVVGAFGLRHPHVNDVQEYMMKWYSWRDCRCYYDEGEDRIVVEGLDEIGGQVT